MKSIKRVSNGGRDVIVRVDDDDATPLLVQINLDFQPTGPLVGARLSADQAAELRDWLNEHVKTENRKVTKTVEVDEVRNYVE